ncbi:MAG: hypothetical protein U5R49_05485 [Deltaproteobacteria bacterium]|nr:hypothetical protein [Deltaproteobacteria bacterium]
MALARAGQDKWKECEGVIDRMMYYNEHIDMKINAAEIDAEKKDSPYEDIRCMARHGKIEAAFYRDNRIRLIKEMLKQDLKPEDYKVHLFLIQAFHKANPDAKEMCNR